MKNVFVKDLKPYKPQHTVSQEMSIHDMVELLINNPEVRYLCVVDENNALIGLIARKRLFQGVFSHHVSAASMVHELYTLITSESAQDLLIRQVQTVKETDELDAVIGILIEHDLGEIPIITEKKKVLGFLTINMILKRWLDEYGRNK